MITLNDILSEEDIMINALVCGDLLMLETIAAESCFEDSVITANKKICEDMTKRFIHTFLEWDLYDKYIYHSSWNITYYQKDKTQTPIVFTTKTDNIQDVEAVAKRKISRLLGKTIHFEKWDGLASNELGEIYKIVDKLGSYHGTVKIDRN